MATIYACKKQHGISKVTTFSSKKLRNSYILSNVKIILEKRILTFLLKYWYLILELSNLLIKKYRFCIRKV